MNILSINNFNIKPQLFSNNQNQNNAPAFGLKLTSPLKNDTVSFQAGKANKAKQIVENSIARTYKKAGDLKDGLTNIRAIKFRIKHVPAHEKNLHLFSKKGSRYLSTPEKKGLATLTNRIKGEFQMSQKAASLGIGHLSDDEILKKIRDISGFSYVIEDPKGYVAVIKDLCDMVKHGEINPILVKYQKLPEEYKKGKLVDSHDSLNPAVSARLRETIKDVKGLKTDLWNTTPSESGYSGLHIIIKNTDGTFSEIQIKVRSVADLKHIEDLYYKMTNGKELAPEFSPLEALLRDIKPANPKKLTDEEKFMQKALNKYSIEAYNFALEHPYEENAPFLSVANAKTLNAKEKEIIAQFDFNRIKMFRQNPEAIAPLAHVEDFYYKVITSKDLPSEYAPLETALKALKPTNPNNLTETEKALQKALNKYRKEAYDYSLNENFDMSKPFLSVTEAKSLTHKEKELLTPYDFNKIKLFVDACEQAMSM